jgi:N,N'-diacetyllegionaminate synthase
MGFKLIAETAWHYQGEYDYMQKLIHTLCKSKTDWIKIHLLLNIDEYINKDHALYQSYKKWMLPEEKWMQLTNIIKQSGKELLVLCNDRASIDFALENNASAIELHAVTVHDSHLLNHLIERVKDKNLPIFIGIGSLPLEEVDALYQQNLNLVMMFGIQNYPTKPEYLALAKQRRLMRLFPKAAFGYADHTEWDHPDNLLLTLMGGLDKTYIEKHVSISPGEKRIDYESAISIDQFNQLRDWLDLAEKAEGTGAFSTNWGEAQYGQIGPMRKAMIACRDFAKGEPFDMDSIIYQRTARTSDLLPFMVQGFTPFFEQDVKAGQIITGKMLTRQK